MQRNNRMEYNTKTKFLSGDVLLWFFKSTNTAVSGWGSTTHDYRKLSEGKERAESTICSSLTSDWTESRAKPPASCLLTHDPMLSSHHAAMPFPLFHPKPLTLLLKKLPELLFFYIYLVLYLFTLPKRRSLSSESWVNLLLYCQSDIFQCYTS